MPPTSLPCKPTQIGKSEFGNMISTLYVNNETLAPGGVISGYVKLTCLDKTFIRGLWVKLCGEIIINYKTTFKHGGSSGSTKYAQPHSILNEVKVDIFEQYMKQRHLQIDSLHEMCVSSRDKRDIEGNEDAGNNSSNTSNNSSNTTATTSSKPAPTADELDLLDMRQQLQSLQADHHNGALHQVLLGK